MQLRFTLIAILSCLFTILSCYEPHFATDPAISSDGQQVCFVFAGDLWSVPFNGGTARRLTATVANEYGPSWSPDGKLIAFTSLRDGMSLVYTMPAAGGPSTVVSRENLTVSDWFSDNKHLLVCKSNLTWGTSLFKTAIDGSGTELIAEIGDYFSALSPANDKLIFNRYGDAYREAYKGSANGNLWEYNIPTHTYTRLTNTDFTERYPRYSVVSSDIYYSASDGARYQLYKTTGNDFSHSEQITSFDTWSVRDISIARKADKIAYELFDTIWCYDPGKSKAERNYKLNIDIAEDDWITPTREESLIDTYDNFSVSVDEALVAFNYKYDLFVQPRKGGKVRQITFNQSGVENLAFLADNRTLIFSQYKEGAVNLYQVVIDSLLQVKPIDWYGKDKYSVDRFYRSSDHHWVIDYTDDKGGGRIAVADADFKNIKPAITDRVVSTGFVCSPDGSMAIYAADREDISIREIYLYDFATGNSRKVMNDDAWVYSFTWLPDQKSILFSRNDDDMTICRLDLIPRDDLELDHDNWKDIYNKPAASADPDTTKVKAKLDKKKDTTDKENALQYAQIDWQQIDKRIRTLLTDSDYLYTVKAIDDTSFYYFKDLRGKEKKAVLYRANLYGRYTTELGTFPSSPDYQIIPDKTMYYKEGDKLKAFGLKSKSKAEVRNEYHYTWNLKTLNTKVFEQVWGVFGRNFYDPSMHNRNWNELYARFKPYLTYTDDTSVLEILVDEIIGEVNASHTGFYPRSDQPSNYKQSAWLGLEFDRRNIPAKGLVISRAYPGSVLYNYFGIRDGDTLEAINGVTLTPGMAMDSLLIGQVNEKIDLLLHHDSKDIRATIKGLSYSQHRDLWYQDKVDRNRAKTDSLSANRIGYVMIPRMNGSEYNNFISQVFTRNADKAALIIDIRGNVGGRIHNDLLTFLSQKPNAYTTGRRSGAELNFTPAHTWTKPLVLLIDENSFSDAEIFPQLFKEAKLGTLIGMPTSGSVIGTWEYKLMDGSTMRMPGSGWYRLDGTNMEGNGAQPDIKVEMSLNDLVADNDLQLKQAVKTLLEKL